MNTKYLDDTLEELCQLGCKKVSMILQQLEQNDLPDEFTTLSSNECDYLHKELKSIMDVYGGGCCEI
jgi:hypothetical protein